MHLIKRVHLAQGRGRRIKWLASPTAHQPRVVVFCHECAVTALLFLDLLKLILATSDEVLLEVS